MQSRAWVFPLAWRNLKSSITKGVILVSDDDRIEVIVGDITKLKVDVIVNAANSRLAGGGGVDGAIHRAAGLQQLRQACRRLGGCPTGEARLTPGFQLPARAIIHTVGPVWQSGDQGESAALRSCYRKSIELAVDQGLSSIAFPAISCGVYGYPHQAAVEIAVNEVRACLEQGLPMDRVVFCCSNEAMAGLYRHKLELQ